MIKLALDSATNIAFLSQVKTASVSWIPSLIMFVITILKKFNCTSHRIDKSLPSNHQWIIFQVKTDLHVIHVCRIKLKNNIDNYMFMYKLISTAIIIGVWAHSDLGGQ